MEKRYYYKSKNGNGLLNLKSPVEHPENYVELTKEEFEEIQPKPHVPTEEEKAKFEIQKQIVAKKAELAKTDYKCLKFIDGSLTEEEYAPIKAARQTLRDEINALEEQL